MTAQSAKTPQKSTKKQGGPTRLVSFRLPVALADDIERAAKERGKKEPWDKTAEIISRLTEHSQPGGIAANESKRISYRQNMGWDMKRVSIWITPAAWDATQAHAAAAGVKRSRFISDSIQSIVMRPVVLAHDEILYIRSAIRELSAIGRNLNQITHQINSDAYQRGTIDLKHDAVIASINGVEPKVQLLMRACKALVDVRERAVAITQS